MSIVDVNAIINGTPDKRIFNAYQAMKETYNETSADEFFNVYSKESLSDILNNSAYIFSECFKGLDFYRDIVLNESSCIFTRLNNEIDKVESYISEYANMMNENQSTKLNDLLVQMKEFTEKYSDIMPVFTYVDEKENGIEEKLSNALYEKDSSKATSILNEAAYDFTLYLYAPYVADNDNFTERANVNDLISKSTDDVSNFTAYVENAVVMNRAGISSTYRHDLSKLANMGTRYIIEAWLDTPSIKDIISDKLKVTPKEAGVVLHEDANDAINSIFNDIYEAALFEESYENRRVTANDLYREACTTTIDLLSHELASRNKDDVVKGYSLVSENTTFDEAYKELSNYADMNGDDFFESSDEDDVDDELDSLSDDIDDDKKDSKSDSKKVDSKKEAPASTTSYNTKPEKPKAKNLATKIQTSAQDLEVKQMNAYSKMKQRGDEIKRAAKAVVALPSNVIKDIKKQIDDLNERDIERRKAYMTQPGYRRKAFRNLKLAIMYGTAAQVKLSLVPTLAVIRHFSKSKDKFVRQELIRDLATEIKVCDAKIEDAQNNNDNHEKYRLIRLRDQLEREKFRVMLNSKKM